MASSPGQRYCSLPFLNWGRNLGLLDLGPFFQSEMISFSPTVPVLLVDSLIFIGWE
jgi:hypothetical protein